MMTPDGDLLRRYAEGRSEAAFAELVQRYVNLVYSAGLRQVNGDTSLAQDVAQSVFTDLARKAATLSQRTSLAGWLYTSTHFAVGKAVRTEQRRHTREQEAHSMSELLGNPTPEFEWEQLGPVLDAVMLELSEPDREALLARYFENRPLAVVGKRLGLSEDAARKRVDRALEKLRALFCRRGITTTATLAAALSTHAVQLAPAGLAAALTNASLAATAGTTATVTLLKVMAMTKVQFGVATLLIAGAAATLMLQHQSQLELRGKNAVLEQELAGLRSDNELLKNHVARLRRATPLLPAPAVQVPAASAPTQDGAATNLYARFKDKYPKLTTDQLESYLKVSGRNAASLVSGYRTTGDAALLTEAMQKYPNDPQVAFEAAFKPDITPEERRQWLEVLKKTDPGNALPNYLSALDYFKSGQPDQAVQELTAASGKAFQDYTSERYQDDTEAFLGAGYSVADAKAASALQLLLPQLGQVKELGLSIVELAKSYRQAGDDNSAQAALQIAADLGQRYSQPSPGEAEISQLVGMTLEHIALNSMDPNAAYQGNGQTIQERLNQLSDQKAELEDFNRRLEPIFPTMSDQDWINYKDRWLMFGEVNAVRWLINKYGK